MHAGFQTLRHASSLLDRNRLDATTLYFSRTSVKVMLSTSGPAPPALAKPSLQWGQTQGQTSPDEPIEEETTMAWLQRKLTTVYVDDKGTRVPKGTPGATKQQIESEKWYGCWKEGKRKVMVPLATDKQASQAMLTDIIRHRERGEAGLVNPYKPHLERAIEEHMNEYLVAVREEGRTAFYLHEKERILKLIFRTTGIKKLGDPGTPDVRLMA
jgi:hypothetical protein